jgi:hypothetical protein
MARAAATRLRILASGLLMLAAAGAPAGVLPEDRADIMYHRYDGGGLTVEGPSVLVRKSIGDSLSATANYYVDYITSASVDVQVIISQASQYREERQQKSLSLDYLRGKSMWTASYMESSENDYDASTWSIGVSQDMFGDLTTISLGYSQGQDDIGNSTDPTFHQQIERRSYRIGLTQVLTRNALVSLNYETITEQGYLQNPYRKMRYLTGPSSWALESEVFPNTRTSSAGSARLKHYLPWRAAAEAHYRFYSDTWGIQAHTAGLAYTHPLDQRWTLTGSYRFYRQNSADFFSDLFEGPNPQNFMARDKETSALSSHTIGLGASYEFPVTFAPWIKRGTANLNISRMMIDYAAFRDLRNHPPGSVEPGTEPLYSLNANIIQFFVSFWFWSQRPSPAPAQVWRCLDPVLAARWRAGARSAWQPARSPRARIGGTAPPGNARSPSGERRRRPCRPPTARPRPARKPGWCCGAAATRGGSSCPCPAPWPTANRCGRCPPAG